MGRKKVRTFLGHGVLSTFCNIMLAISPALYTTIGIYVKDYSLREALAPKLLILMVLPVFFAFPTYLFYEIKHLVAKSQRVGEVNTKSVIFFGTQSILGLVIQVYIIVSTLYMYDIQNIYLTTLLMAFLAAFGGCIGLIDLTVTLSLKLLVKHSLLVIQNPKLVRGCIGTTTLLYVLSNVTYNIIQKVGF